MPPSLTPDQIIPSSFLDNLSDDFIAVDTHGTVIGRAATREALERSCPDATYFNGAEIDPMAPMPGKSFRAGRDDRGLMTLEPVDLTISTNVVSAALDKMKAHGVPENATAAIEPPVEFPAAPAGGETTRDIDAIAPTAQFGTPGTDADPRNLHVAPVVDVNPEPTAEPATPVVDTPRPDNAFSKFDPDRSGAPGGSLRGAESTASRGKTNRQRKPSGGK